MTQAKLYQYEVCPFCWKARVALALKKQNYETIEVHPLNKKELAFSDYKKVPVYIDTQGHQINDSTQIMRHIDQEFPEYSLFESDPEKIEKENQWLEWSEKYVRSIPPLIYNTYPNALKAFDYITKNTQFAWHQRSLIKFSGAGVMTLVAKKTSKKLGIENPQNYFTQFLNEWSEALAGQDFIGGHKPNGADAAVYGLTLSVSGLPASRIVKEHKNFSEWLSRMEEKTKIPFRQDA
jgi:microsomal prostaglandin-E synthase 2